MSCVMQDLCTPKPGEISAPSRIRTPCLDIQVSRDLGTLADPTLPAASASQVRSRHPHVPLALIRILLPVLQLLMFCVAHDLCTPKPGELSASSRVRISLLCIPKPGEVSAPSQIRISLLDTPARRDLGTLADPNFPVWKYKSAEISAPSRIRLSLLVLPASRARSRYPQKSPCPSCNFTCHALRTSFALPSQARSRHPRRSESPCWTYQPGEISAPSRIRISLFGNTSQTTSPNLLQ